MIVKRTWHKIKSVSGYKLHKVDIRFEITGYFLFGIIPLYIKSVPESLLNKF